MPPSFLHLHAHSHYSLLDALPSPAELARAAAKGGMEALALTDHNGLSGAVEFHDACRVAGVRPIHGLELDVLHPADAHLNVQAGSLVLLAMDLTGWRSLCRLSTSLLTSSDRNSTGEIPFETLTGESSSLICLTGGKRGLAARLLSDGRDEVTRAFLARLRESFIDRLYVELQIQSPADRDLASRLVVVARSLSLPVVATNNVHYLRPEQAYIQRLLTAIRLNRPLSALPADTPAPEGSYFTSSHEMEERFTGFPDALAATREIADRCRLELPLGVPHYPEVPLPPGLTAVEALRERAQAGALRQYGELSPALADRLDHELEVIGNLGYAPLFLIMEDIIAHARQSGVPLSSRGSAASSLVAHCLGITSPDPMRLNLYFERFLNPARATPPDIDTDLCSRRREGVIRYVYHRYGDDRVAMVSTINRFRARSALREAAKAHGLPPAQVSELADSLPHRGWGPGRGDSRDSPYESLAAQYPSPFHRQLFADAAALIGLPRLLSVHPGGVVITPGPMTDLVPTLLASKGVVVTQFDGDSVERMGLVKIDLLGIRGLTVLGDVAEATQAPSPARSIPEFLDSIPENDPATSELLRNGRTIGCFQIESPGMRATLREVQAQSVDDLMVALALYRPGPLTGGLKDSFVRRHLGQEPVEHLHPALAPLLADTLGVILYQEQVLRIAHELAGLSLAEADLLRRAMSHFDPGKQMQTLKENFLAGAEALSGVPHDIGERVWELMAAFAGYGFPKAHAASYAQVSWRAAWCKVHFPGEFMAAVLANWGGYYSQRVYLTESRRMGLAVRPPHINHSQREFSLSRVDGRPALYVGLDQVRDLTQRTQKRIVQGRPFHSLNDFLARVDPHPREAENLVRVGALEGFANIPTLLRWLGTGVWQRDQPALFVLDEGEEEDWPLALKLQAEEEILGTAVLAHPLELASEKIAAAGALSIVAAAGRVGQRVRVAGMRQTGRRSRSERGAYIYYMGLEDLEGLLDAVFEEEVYRRNRAALSGAGPYVIEGVVELDPERGEPILRAERVWRVE